VSLRLALREIRNHPRFAAFFTLNLALGFAGFAALDAFERSVSGELRQRSKAYLAADVAVSAGRPLADEEVRHLDSLAGADVRISRAAQLFSMAAGEGRSRLVEIHAIDSDFPLYGAVVLEDTGPAGPEQKSALRDAAGAWVDPPLLTQLDVDLGDELRIGSATFRIQGAVARDGSRGSSGFSIAPRVYIALAQLERTGLVATGSRVQYRRTYRLPPGADSDGLARSMRLGVADPAIAVRSHREATRDLARAYASVSDHLGLVALIAIFLAGLGAAHLFRSFLSRRVRELAVLLCLGTTRGTAQLVFFVQVGLLSLAASLCACGIAALLLPALTRLAGGFVPPDFQPRVGWQAVGLVLLLSATASASACLPLVARLRSLKPAELFAEHAQPALGRGPRDALLLLPALALFWLVAVWRTGSFSVGSAFIGVFTVALAVLLLLAVVGLRGLGALPLRRPLAARLALRELARSRASTVSGFVAIALCALLASIPPQMRAALARELEAPEASRLPSLFLFDIQPEQVAPLERHVTERGASLQRVSPMVRARLTSHNGESLREQPTAEPPPGRTAGGAAEARRLRARRHNLTWRADLTDSERIRAGRPFSGPHHQDSEGPAELSLEVNFAERLGVGLGDTLAFDVQGVPVEGRVVNLREVRWNSFQPNFFVAFNPGVLDGAPATFLASVPRLPDDDRLLLQTSIVDAFPNVSVIDVTRAVARLVGLVVQLHWAITSTGALSIVVGLLLVFAIARDQARARRWETNLLKVLGADFSRIRHMLDLEFGVLGLLASLAGCALGLAASRVLATSVLDAPWTVSWPPLLLVLAAVPLVCVVTGRAAARSVLRERPLALLQADGD
jgi:putative ABC transport system permease protein